MKLKDHLAAAEQAHQNAHTLLDSELIADGERLVLDQLLEASKQQQAALKKLVRGAGAPVQGPNGQPAKATAYKLNRQKRLAAIQARKGQRDGR